ncbi:O-antigen polymerase [Streptococcus anginosus]|uniref:O-antigen polymerase n=1 Tax=Streptococcus anginosus TaxID=1328 RepID=UPI002EDB3792
MLYVSFFISLLFLIINYIIVDKDYFHPSVIFVFVFSVAQLLCILNSTTYGIVFNEQTLFVLAVAMVVFTVITSISRLNFKNNSTQVKEQLEPIVLSTSVKVIFLIIQLLTLYLFHRYQQSLYMTYKGGVGSFSELINNYDQLTKFSSEELLSLGVRQFKLYSYFKALTEAGTYIIIYVTIQNYLVNKKISKLNILIITTYCLFLLMHGSRSPLFRVVTATLAIIYLLVLKRAGLRKLGAKFAGQIVVILLALIPLFILFLDATGRIGGANESNWNRELFVYIGAPLLNLNNYLEHTNFIGLNTRYFGEQTFLGLHNILSNKLHLYNFYATGVIGAKSFVNSNGLSTGNVFTTFYQIIYDFSLWGVAPIVAIFSSYYILTYDKILTAHKEHLKIDVRIFFYAYLINDLIMLFFSNRFFETTLSLSFIKFAVTAIVIIWIINQDTKIKFKWS